MREGTVLDVSIKRKTIKRRLFVCFILVLLFLPLAAWVAAQLLIVQRDLATSDAIAVFSGSATYIERADWAAKLYRDGRAPIVILTNDGTISGWDARQERNPYFYELTSRRLQQQGVPVNRIEVAQGLASGTYEESLLIRDYATAHQLRRILIVTSAYHSRRALWSMNRACQGSGIEIGLDAAPPGEQTPSPWRWWLHRWGWRVVAGEYLKMIYYWAQY